MRSDIKLMLLVNGIIILIALTQTFDLITLLHDDSFSQAILEKDTKPVVYTKDPVSHTLTPDRNLMIPKIIHQTYKNETIPSKWMETQQSVLNLHPDYEYILWTDQMSRDFIEKHYSWFLETFDSYQYPIERADVIRYFILYHYGGIYIDLDNGTKVKLDPLLAFPAWLRKTAPTGVSNDLMGSIPNHPFFGQVIDQLKRYNRNWLVPYITIMYSTGPLFLSVIWKRYKRWGVPEGGEVRILMPYNDSKPMTQFFFVAQGSSWHLGDAQFIFFMGKHWIIFFILGTALVISIFYLQLKFYQALLSGSIERHIRSLFRWMREVRTNRFAARLSNSNDDSAKHSYELLRHA